jgi:hypothetical protein
MRPARTKPVEFIVIHCSASGPKQDIGAADIDSMHKARGWQGGIGYHLVIRRSGKIEAGEHLNSRGAHAVGYNENSVSVCMVGGIDEKGKPANNFTPEQWDFIEDCYRPLQKNVSDCKYCWAQRFITR